MRGPLSTCNSYEEFQNTQMDRCKISEWEVVLAAPNIMYRGSLKNPTSGKNHPQYHIVTPA